MPTSSVTPSAYQEALRVAFAAARATADRYRAELMQDPNVIDVQPGYKFTDGWITDTPAVVVTVLRKDPLETLGDAALPESIDGIPVDVAPATPAQQLRHRAATTRGTALPPGAETEPLLAPGDTPGEVDATRAAGAGGRAYKEPKNLKLSAVSGAMTLTCHVSPDAGWPTLKKFLDGAKKSLTVAMYDFGAKHIFQAIKDAMEADSGSFVLNLDRRSNPKREGELTEEEVVKKFKAALGSNFEPSTAAVGVLYPNAYHIKVAVRDSSAFWLSSGNWQQSNQPEADGTKLDQKGQRQLLSSRNREWHVVCENAKLAKLFEEYIKFDVAEAKRVAAAGGERAAVPPLPELVLPPEADFRAAAKKLTIFPAKQFKFTAKSPVKIQPILTPDNYGQHVVELIKKAKKTLFFQNQYIKIPKQFQDGAGKPALKELVEALLDRQNAGVDVRIILRNEGETRDMLQALKTFGFELARVRLQAKCHNKGIVVDSKMVLVSSQNYSGVGVRFNRDAGLIISDAKVAKYYEDVFLYDWDNRATQKILGEERGGMPLLREVAAGAPEAGTRSAARTMSWSEYYDE